MSEMLSCPSSIDAGRFVPGPSIDLNERRTLKCLFVLEEKTFDLIYGGEPHRKISALAHLIAEPQTRESIAGRPDLLREVEVIFSGWGAPIMNKAFLDAAPNLKAVFYGAGSIGYFVSEEFWRREIMLTSSAGMNAQPVAEYTLSTILLSLKKFWGLSHAVRSGGGCGDHTRHVTGAFRSKVALISCGMIARRVITLLKNFDIECLVYDPFLSNAEARKLGVRLCSLDEAFREGDVVSLHAPDKLETQGMITGHHFAQMKREAAFINTARPRIVRQDEMIEVLRSRPDLQVILDVCEPEPLPKDSPLLGLPNVIVTPHIAGSLGPECGRLGEFMLAEFERYLAGESLIGEVTPVLAAIMA
jgi:phosphoglycerate dehydrogenase-like enzyme